LGDLDWVATADLLNPDVVFSAAIGTVGNEAAVRRPGGPSLQAVIERDPSKGALDGRCRNTRTPFPVGKPSCDCQQDERGKHNQHALSLRPVPLFRRGRLINCGGWLCRRFTGLINPAGGRKAVLYNC